MTDALDTYIASVAQETPIVLVEYFDAHYYKITDNGITFFFPSVTTKLGIIDKPNLARWRGDVGNREADLRMYDASQQGKRIHWAWEVAQKGGAVVYDPWQNPIYTPEGIADLKAKYGEVVILRTQEEMRHVVKLKRQFDLLKPKVLGVEKKVYDLEHRDAGTIDAIYEIAEGEYPIAGSKPLFLPRGVYINDLKTGSYIDDKVWLQLAPYAVMWEKMMGIQVAGALVTHSGSTIKSGVPGLKTLYRPREILLTKDYADYRHAAALWERDHEGDEPEQFQFPSLITLGGQK